MIEFTKGHGTHNDFVLIADPEGKYDLDADLIRRLTDRRGGVGADGVIRLAPTASIAATGEKIADDILAQDPSAIWFMDYRNADGSIAEMCGNGVRVFAAFAEQSGLLAAAADADTGATEFALGTRAGIKHVVKEHAGWYAVNMGPWRLAGGEQARSAGYDAGVVVHGWKTPRPGLSVDLGNPHTVVAISDVEELASLDLTVPPEVAPTPPHGTNVELVVPLGDERTPEGETVGRIRMRVHERGVGETPSCGTGACAAALAVRAWQGDAAPIEWRVEVLGGEVRVRLLADNHVELAGPAELTFSGTFTG